MGAVDGAAAVGGEGLKGDLGEEPGLQGPLSIPSAEPGRGWGQGKESIAHGLRGGPVPVLAQGEKPMSPEGWACLRAPSRWTELLARGLHFLEPWVLILISLEEA